MRTIEWHGRKLVVLSGRTSLGRERLLENSTLLSRDGSMSVQLMDARSVFGPDHIESAFDKAMRAFDRKENVADTPLMETMLYMSGRRQIVEALEVMGLGDDTQDVVCIAIAPAERMKEISTRLSIEEDDEVLTDLASKEFDRLGISDTELESVPAQMRLELVLEKVAQVDIIKR